MLIHTSNIFLSFKNDFVFLINYPNFNNVCQCERGQKFHTRQLEPISFQEWYNLIGPNLYV